jgi:hypothetical protein
MKIQFLILAFALALALDVREQDITISYEKGEA